MIISDYYYYYSKFVETFKLNSFVAQNVVERVESIFA